MSASLIYRLEGAYSTVGDADTAFSGGARRETRPSSSASQRREWARWFRRSWRLAQVRSARTGWPTAWV